MQCSVLHLQTVGLNSPRHWPLANIQNIWMCQYLDIVSCVLGWRSPNLLLVIMFSVCRNMFHNCVFEERLIVVVTYYRHSSPVSISLVTYYTQPNPPSQDTMMEDCPPLGRGPHQTTGISRKTLTLLILTRQINRKKPTNQCFLLTISKMGLRKLSTFTLFSVKPNMLFRQK